MAVTVTMPQLGETVTEGTILSWAKQPGDMVEEDEVLLEISTDKVDTEVPSPTAGVLQEILVAEGETVTVGTPLAVLAESGESVAPAAPVSEEPEVVDAPEPAPTLETATPPPATEPIAAPAPQVVEPVEAPASAPEPTPLAPAATAPAAAAAAPSTFSAPSAAVEAPRRGILSPVVRRLAGEHDVDLDQVSGTGEGGRITRKDVMDFVAGRTPPAASAFTPVAASPVDEPKVEMEPAAPPVPLEAVASAPQPAAPPSEPVEPVPAGVPPRPTDMPPPSTPATPPQPPAPEPEPPAPSAPAPSAPAPATAGGISVADGDQVVDLSRLRRRIAENMVQAKHDAAHVWASIEVDYEGVERVRQANKVEFKEREGFSLTYLPFIARATMDALKAFPVVNSSFYLDEGKQIYHGSVNLGIAVDMNQEGLVVVTIRGADEKRMSALARDIRTMAIRARDGKITPDDVTGSTFTITNPGPYGSFMTNPVINMPNVAILSTDTVSKRPVVVELPDGSDSIAIHHIGYLGLTWDHRAFDGSTAVLFLNRIRENLETWDWEQELA